MRRAVLPAFFALVCASSAAAAVPWGTTPVDLVLGGGAIAHRVTVWCARRLPCPAWRAEGFAPPPGPLVEMYGAGAAGRIFAATSAAMLFTDDRGASWREAAWDGSQAARAMAFDPATGRGAAVGTDGCVWTTGDNGASWRLRRDTGDDLVDVAVLDDVVVWIGARGAVVISPDGGSTQRVLVEESRGFAPVLRVAGGLVWILVAGGRWWRVDPAGAAELSARGP